MAFQSIKTSVTEKTKRGTLFFLSGFPDQHSVWDAQVAFFTEMDFDCVVACTPGFDQPCLPEEYTLKEIAKMIKDQIGLLDGKVTFIAHNLGVAIGSVYMQLHGTEKVQSVTMVSVGNTEGATEEEERGSQEYRQIMVEASSILSACRSSIWMRLSCRSPSNRGCVTTASSLRAL